jgi:lipoate-protein ligase A
VVAPEEGRSVLEAYGWVAGGLVAGLHQLGIEATVAGHPATGRPLDCFAVATGADLAVGGRKICGSAQVRRRGWFLQHGSLPIVDIREKMATLLGDNADRTSTCVEEWRPGTTWSETASALIAGFAVAWGVEPSRRRPERFEWGSGGEAPQYRGVPEGPRAAAVLRNPLGMV